MSLSVTVKHCSLISHAPSVHIRSDLYVAVFYCLHILFDLILMVLYFALYSALQMRLVSVYFRVFIKVMIILGMSFDLETIISFCCLQDFIDCRFTTFKCVCVYTNLKECLLTFAIFLCLCLLCQHTETVVVLM